MDTEYIEWIQDLKQRYQAAQLKAAAKVNSEQLLFNLKLGHELVTCRAGEKWGKGVVEQVSLDMQDAFPNTKGFGTSNLWNMKKWYRFYAENRDESEFKKLQQFVGEMPFLKMTIPDKPKSKKQKYVKA